MRRFVGTSALVLVIAALGAAPGTAQEQYRSFTLAAAGDVLIHGAVARRAAEYAGGNGYDFTPMTASIEPWIGDADFSICHLEGTLSPNNTGLAYYPTFNAPHEVADAIAAAGYDTCSMGGNHSMDRGWTGLVETLEVLDAAGVRHDGTARTPEERLPGLYEVNGVSVAHMSYTYGLNGIPKPDGKPWSANYIETDLILSDAAWARDQGAEFVIISMHWGTEYQSAPTAQQRQLAETLLGSSDIDLILGSHVHVVQPIDWIGDKLVVYGMGNHISNQVSSYGPTERGTEEGVVVHISVEEQPGGRFVATEVQFTPTRVELPSYRILPTAYALAVGVEPAAWLQFSQDRTVARILMLGTQNVEPTPAAWSPVSCVGTVATIVGTNGADLLLGTAGPDVIVGRGGNDTIYGMGGDDLICGDDGDDTITGDAGRDHLLGGSGNDWLDGGPGTDAMWGGQGADRLIGGPEWDLYFGILDGDLFGWAGTAFPLP